MAVKVKVKSNPALIVGVESNPIQNVDVESDSIKNVEMASNPILSIESNTETVHNYLEKRLNDEISDRVSGDAYLQKQIDEITIEGVKDVKVDGISVVDSQRVANIDLSIIKNDINVLKVNVATLDITMPKKLDKNISILPSVSTRVMTLEDADKMLLYIYNNGIPSKAKLDELLFNYYTD